jgi:eukaryotic-like serine/threonine-protein kinase
VKPDRLARMQALLQASAELPAPERPVFLRRACGDDPELCREIEGILAHDQATQEIRHPDYDAARPIPSAPAPASDERAVVGPGRGQPAGPELVGRTLNQYRVDSKLGEGGMGVVYEATDTRLGRKVAIKLLHRSVLQDADRMARFQREARVLASLNHANIAAIHGLEEAAGTTFLALEYVPGDTLAERLARGSLPLREVLTICRQIAEGIEAAHEQGIIHRDLKPANIKITPGGQVKVLDFGLAKAAGVFSAAAAGGTERTVASNDMTHAGMIVGTAAYMSPEQACGKPVDRRTDVWAFGCLLFETLARRPAFSGGTLTEVLAAVVERSPDWTLLPATVPENVKCLLRRCLTKDRHSRLRDIGDARLELEETLSGRVGVAAATAARTRRFWPAVAVAGVLASVSIGVWARSQARGTSAQDTVRFTHALPAGQRMVPGWNPSVVFSPDGKSLAFSYTVDGVATSFRRPIDELAQKPLGGVIGLEAPVFSPDGRWVAMVDNMDLKLKKVAVSGGAPVPLTVVDMFGRGDWAKDGYIYFTDRYPGALVRIPENGGPQEPVTALNAEKEEFTHRHAQVLPGGKAIIFTVVSSGMGSYNDARVELQVLGTKQRKILIQDGFGARYAPSGHIVYANGGNLYAVPFDLSSLEVKGLPVKVVDGVQMSTNTGSAYFDVSSTGALAYVPGMAEGGERSLVWVDRQGKAEPLPLKPASFLFPRLSPDGRTLAVEIEGATHNLYTYDFARTVLSQVTTDGLSHAPLWTPDGKDLCYRSWKAGTMTMWEMPADRSRPGERLTDFGARQSAVSVSPDGRYLAYNQMGDMSADSAKSDMAMGGGMGSMGTGSDIWVLPLQGADRTPQRFKGTKYEEASPKFSPDGRWVAYCSNDTGKSEAYVEPWPGPSWKVQISSEGGTDPLWNHAGTEIFYRNGDKMMVVPVKTAGGFVPGVPRVLWEGHYSQGLSSSCGPPGVSASNYDVSADGQRFLMIKDGSQDVGSSSIVVVLNWSEELKRAMREPS